MIDGKQSEEWDDDTRIPFIDGGTEGFLGNARFIYPYKTPCFDCVDLFPAQQHVYQMCTLVNTPRIPEHCVAWAKDYAWVDEAPFGKIEWSEPVRIDGEKQEHIEWCLKKAIEYAEKFNIPTDKLTHQLTQGVVKNTISATVVNTPHQPEHCIAWAKDKAWEEELPFGKKTRSEAIRIDGDNPEHIGWCWMKAIEHANRFNIPTDKLTYKLTQGVVKNIIPAIAATNAIIAALCANEAFKVVTECSRNLNNFIYYFGNTGVGSNTQRLEKKEDCSVCSIKRQGFAFKSKKEATLRQFLDKLQADERFMGLGNEPVLTRCNIKNEKSYLTGRFAKGPSNLSKAMSELVEEGDIIGVTDKSSSAFIIKVYWE